MKNSGYNNFRFNKVRIQIYSPKVRLFKDEIYFAFDTCFRIFFSKIYIGFGFQILGCGIGFDWDKEYKEIK